MGGGASRRGVRSSALKKPSRGVKKQKEEKSKPKKVKVEQKQKQSPAFSEVAACPLGLCKLR